MPRGWPSCSAEFPRPRDARRRRPHRRLTGGAVPTPTVGARIVLRADGLQQSAAWQQATRNPTATAPPPISTWSWSAPASPGCTCSTGSAGSASRRVLETGDDVGGTWYWNRYPGARCDIPTTDYSYSWDPELETEWDVVGEVRHPARDPALPAARRRQARPAPRHPLLHPGRRRRAGTTTHSRWTITHRATATTITCRWYVMATGCLSMPKDADIAGADRFRGRRVLHEPLAARGRRLHRQARRRDRHRARRASSRSRSSPSRPPSSPCSSARRTSRMPARNGPRRRGAPGRDRRRPRRLPRGRPSGRAAACRSSRPVDTAARRHATRSSAARFEAGVGGRRAVRHPRRRSPTRSTNQAANDVVAEFIRDKIRSIVDDPETAEALCPKDHPFGTKRPCLDTGYYETFNLPHVRLVDLRKHADHHDHRDRHRDQPTRRSSSTSSSTPPASTR